MSKKQIDRTAGRMGMALRHARRHNGLNTDDAAPMLHIMPDELAAFEHGHAEMPMDILLYIFTMGYKMIQIRMIERRYHNMRQILHQSKQYRMSTPE